MILSVEQKDVEFLAERIASIILKEIKPQNKLQVNDSFITRHEAAELLKVSHTTLSEYCKQGVIPSYRIGRKILFKEIEIEEAVTRGLRYSHNRRGGVK